MTSAENMARINKVFTNYAQAQEDLIDAATKGIANIKSVCANFDFSRVDARIKARMGILELSASVKNHVQEMTNFCDMIDEREGQLYFRDNTEENDD